MPGRSDRADRADGTRDLILTSAERLFAEHGVGVVSNRRVGAAAGQGNNFAVGYHFGAKAELVRAIIRKHTDHVERIRREMVAEVGDSRDPRDWVACLVHPTVRHLAESDPPTWFARFGAQIMTDPALWEIMIEEALSTPSLVRIMDSLNATLPVLPVRVRLARNHMARNLIVHMCAEHERALADGSTDGDWCQLAGDLVDAIVGLYTASVAPGR